MGDGNCGFRSVAVGIGLDENMWSKIRQDLLQELDNNELIYTAMWHNVDFQRIRDSVNFRGNGCAPRDKWMLMPATGFVIASLYNRPVIFLSVQQNYTCFPLWYGPNWSQPSGPIVIAHVRGDHYINVTLDESCPFPPNHPQWRRYKSRDASEWQDIYLSRQLM